MTYADNALEGQDATRSAQALSRLDEFDAAVRQASHLARAAKASLQGLSETEQHLVSARCARRLDAIRELGLMLLAVVEDVAPATPVAVFAGSTLPDDASADALPAYGGVEMLATSVYRSRLKAHDIVVERDPLAFGGWDVQVRVNPTLSRAEFVRVMLAMTGAVEAERLPDPEEAAAHPCGRVITLGADPAGAVETE